MPRWQDLTLGNSPPFHPYRTWRIGMRSKPRGNDLSRTYPVLTLQRAIGRRHSRRQHKMANPVVHFEIRSEDPDATRAFFGDLFGWTYPEGAFPGYTFVERARRPFRVASGRSRTATRW